MDRSSLREEFRDKNNFLKNETTHPVDYYHFLEGKLVTDIEFVKPRMDTPNINENYETSDILMCDCGSTEHNIIVRYDEEDKIVYCDIHLNNYRSFISRLKHGIKYIFGYKSRYGDWDQIIFNRNDYNKFVKITKLLKND